MSYSKCNKCGEYHFDREPCKDVYLAYHEEYDEEGIPLRADSFTDAAERFAEFYDGNEHILLSADDSTTVEIENTVGERKRFIVHASVSIDYYAKEL